jgi:twitching motility protein PilT
MQLASLLAAAREHQASDILLSPGSPPALRVDGLLRPVDTPPLDSEAVEALTREVVPASLRGRLAAGATELDFAAVVDGERFRGNAYLRAGVRALALRPIPAKIPSPAQLGLPTQLIELAHRSHGLILFTGAAGQGKTTSQAAILDFINRTTAGHVVTIEDPVEFVHTARRCVVDQREIGSDTPDFATALKYVLRQNPDVILVGEIRDPETASAVLTVAETGHLVLSTVHANDACQAVDRLVDMFPAWGRDQVRLQLGLTLLAIVNQRLVRSRAGRRVLAAELLLGTSAVSKLIRDGRTEQLYGMLDLEVARGMQSMNRVLAHLVADGTVDEAEAARYLVARESQVPQG